MYQGKRHPGPVAERTAKILQLEYKWSRRIPLRPGQFPQSHYVEDASPEVLESMEVAANIHDEEC